MANWQFSLDLKDAWKKHDEGEMSIVDVAKAIATRGKGLVVEIKVRADIAKRTDEEFSESLKDMARTLEQDILPMFEELVETENDDVEEFDNALEDLYDWADEPLGFGRKMCWVSTVI